MSEGSYQAHFCGVTFHINAAGSPKCGLGEGGGCSRGQEQQGGVPGGHQQRISNRHQCAQTCSDRVSLALEGALLASLFGSTWTWQVPCFAIPVHGVQIWCLNGRCGSRCLRARVSLPKNFGCFHGPKTVQFCFVFFLFSHWFYFFCIS